MIRLTSILIAIIMAITLLSCIERQEERSNGILPYTPVDAELYEQILRMDKEFFAAYNHCDLDKQASIYSDDLEFYHDKGGLMTSKAEIIEATKKNICGKVTRELVEGSIEVYPIHNYGAVQIGYHKFYNNQEPDAESTPSKFITMWQMVEEDWELSQNFVFGFEKGVQLS